MMDAYPADYRKYSAMLGAIAAPHAPLEITPGGIEHASYCWKIVYPSLAGFVGMIKLGPLEILAMARMPEDEEYALLEDKFRLLVTQ